MTRPFWKYPIYFLMHAWSRIGSIVFFRFRCDGRGHIPSGGPLLVCSNHQSFLDPVLVGICFNGRMNFLARKTLFQIPGLGRLIRHLDAIPVDREGMSLAGIKETLRRLKKGERVLVFPEGTRTLDGKVGPLKPGFCALARRGRTTLVPVGCDGAFDAWPRTAWLPRPTTIAAAIGPPLEPDQIAQLSDEQLIAELRKRIADCLDRARQRRASTAGT